MKRNKKMNPTKLKIKEMAEYLEAKSFGECEELVERAFMCANQPVSESDFDVIDALLTEIGEY